MPPRQRPASKPKAGATAAAAASTEGTRRPVGGGEGPGTATGEEGEGGRGRRKGGVSWSPVFKRIGVFLLIFLVPALLNYAALNQETRMLVPSGKVINFKGGVGGACLRLQAAPCMILGGSRSCC